LHEVFGLEKDRIDALPSRAGGPAVFGRWCTAGTEALRESRASWRAC
jgi:hypothetical protein